MQHELFYSEEQPSKNVAHFVQSFWEFRASEHIKSPIMHRVFPDGCLSLIYFRNPYAAIKRLIICSINRKSIAVPITAGDQIWGMRIFSDVTFAYLNRKPPQFASSPFNRETAGTRYSEQLWTQLNASDNFCDAIEAFERYSRKYGVAANKVDKQLRSATNSLLKADEGLRISELARSIGISERQLERKFKKATGLTPKQFAMICRFRSTAIDLVQNAKTDWAVRAVKLGFADQSHLIKNFNELTGTSPQEFTENLDKIRHGKIIV
ncbi:MAG: helix-turn-helix domain-containing protein [Pyrinomonadaceae bacterium]